MESKKPRGIAIPAARAVAAADAFLLTPTLSGSFSAGSVPIRAPLTIDDDDDDSGSVTDEHNSAISDASSYSRGIDSETDDGFESVSGEADDETELEDVSVGGVRIHRLVGEELGGETGDRSDFSGGSVIYRPFAGDADEETSVNYSSFEEESENSDEVSEADRVSMKAKVVIPRAVLSLDDDEFDEIRGSDDEEAVLLRLTKVPGDEETEIKDRALQFGDKGVGDESECSGSFIGEFVSTEEEAVRMNYTNKLADDLMSFVNINEQSLGVPLGGCNDFMVENEGNGLGQSFKQLIIKKDGSGNIHESEALMKLGDVGVEDSAVESGEMLMTDKPECSGFITGELGSTEEDMVQEKFSEDGLVNFETYLGVAPGDCNANLVESEGNSVDVDRGLDQSFSQLVVVEQGVGKGSISEESNNRLDDSRFVEAHELMIPAEGCKGRIESGDEEIGNMIGEAKECWENDCGDGNEVEEPECEEEPKIVMSSESFQLTPILNSVTTRNLEVAGGVDIVVSGGGFSDQKAEEESEIVGNQESEDIDRKLLFPEDGSSSFRCSIETANETVETEEHMSEHINKQVNFQSDSEPNQISVGTETNLLSVKDVERTMPEYSSVIAYDIMENETHMGQLIHNHTFMELDEYEGIDNRREKPSESAFQNYSEELSSAHSVQLISEKVKERVEKTQLLKEKLQRIIRGTGLCSEKSAGTEVVSELSLAGEHQTSLGHDYVSNETKMMMPEQEVPGDLDFSINVLVIGKTGVGKSATVNSIFGETKSPVGAFGVTTKSANYVVGNIGGIVVRILDTPGLMSSATEERFNQEVLMSIKKSMRTFPVDVILYIDRLDEHPDSHLLRIITSSLGSLVWRNTIVVLTHAASSVPDSSSYKEFIAQRSSLMHQSIRQSAPELSCVDQSKMPRIVLAENNNSESTCQDWRWNLLILCCSVKIRSKAGSLQKQNAVVEKAAVFGSQLRSFTLFCSLWNVLLLGSNSGHPSHSHDGEKKRRLLDFYPQILWEEQSQECLEQETLLVENQEPEIKGARARTRRGRLGFQATKRFGIYLDTSGFSIGSGGCRKEEEEEEEGKILVRMSVLRFVPILMSIFTCVYGRKEN